MTHSRTRHSLRLALLSILLILPAFTNSSSQAQSPEDAHTFTETGHTVRGLFWIYWQSHGGLAQQGYPISEEMQEKSDTDGKTYTVQYFERAVFEQHAENKPPYDVLLSLVGRFAYDQKYPNSASGQTPNTSPGSQLFNETGKRLGGKFLAYWQKNGGLAQQGYPISDEFQEKSDLDGKTYTVQYFERAVFELHSENQAPYDVLLTQLGTLRLRQRFPNGAPKQQVVDLNNPSPLPGDWPMYGHDPQHTGYNPAEHTISASNVDKLVSLWQANVGIGKSPSASSPSVYNGHVYVGSSVPSGPNFFAFKTSDGSQVWKVDLGFKDTCYKVGIGSTPAISGGLVVAGGGDGAYYGLDSATGATVWRDPTQAQPSGFAWTSPLFLGSRVIYGVSSYCDKPPVPGEVRAFDAAAGLLMSNLPLVPGGSIGASVWNSPALSPDGRTLVVATGEQRGEKPEEYAQAIIALDAATLQVRDSVQQGPLDEAIDQDWGSSPVIFHDIGGRTLVGVHNKNDRFYVYDLNNLRGGPVWSKHSGTQIGLMAAYDPNARPGGILFVPAKNGYLYAVDPATGTNIWFASNLGKAHNNIAIANGLIFMNVDSVGVLVIDEQTGKTLRTLVPENVETVFSGVSVANGVVYFLSGGYLNAWGLR